MTKSFEHWYTWLKESQESIDPNSDYFIDLIKKTDMTLAQEVVIDWKEERETMLKRIEKLEQTIVIMSEY